MRRGKVQGKSRFYTEAKEHALAARVWNQELSQNMDAISDLIARNGRRGRQQ
jgi:hypothetical protein